MCASADLKPTRQPDSIDEFATANGLDSEVSAPDRPGPTLVPTPPTELALADFATVISATGHAPSYPWLEQQLLDPKGAIEHDGGVMTRPGMYVLGLTFGRRRKSSFLDGVGPDAQDLSAHLAGYLDRQAGARLNQESVRERAGG